MGKNSRRISEVVDMLEIFYKYHLDSSTDAPVCDTEITYDSDDLWSDAAGLLKRSTSFVSALLPFDVLYPYYVEARQFSRPARALILMICDGCPGIIHRGT